MEILIDVNGSDNGMDEAVKGVVNVVGKTKAKLTLVGDENRIIEIIRNEYLTKADNIIKQINILDAKDAITNFDDPAMAIKHK